MKNLLFLAAATVAGVAFCGVDVSGSFNAHIDEGALAAVVSILSGIVTLANCSHKSNRR